MKKKHKYFKKLSHEAKKKQKRVFPFFFNDIIKIGKKGYATFPQAPLKVSFVELLSKLWKPYNTSTKKGTVNLLFDSIKGTDQTQTLNYNYNS